MAVIAREQIQDDLLGLPHDPHHPRMPVHPFIEERLDGGLGLCHFDWECDQCVAVVANLIHAARTGARKTPLCLRYNRSDKPGNQFPHQFGATPVGVEALIVPVDGNDDVACDGDGLEVIDSKQSCAQAIVDIVGVIGNVVGDRGGLRFQRGKGRQLEIVEGDEIGDARGNATFTAASDGRAAARHQGTIVFDDAFERFPGQIEAVEIRIAVLQRGHDAQGLRIMIKSAVIFQTGIQCPLASVTERGMAEIMRQRQRLGEILVEPELTGKRAGNLRDFQRVRQARAIMIALVKYEYLCLVLQAAERGRMNDPVAITPERTAGFARRFLKLPSAA